MALPCSLLPHCNVNSDTRIKRSWLQVQETERVTVYRSCSWNSWQLYQHTVCLLQALALDEEVPDIAELEDETEPDVLGISKHRTTLVRGGGGGLDFVIECVWQHCRSV